MTVNGQRIPIKIQGMLYKERQKSKAQSQKSHIYSKDEIWAT